MKKIISIVLALIMVMAYAPATFATEQVPSVDGQDVNQSAEQSEQAAEDDLGGVEKGNILSEESTAEVAGESQQSEAKLLTVNESNMQLFTIGTGRYKTVFSQEKINYRKVNVKIPSRQTLVSAGFTKEKIQQGR